jgi:putative tricarboxylic transport membrane protein
VTDMSSMSSDTGPAVTYTLRRDSWWRGRGDLAVGVPALIAAGFLLVGTVTMDVRGESEPGPQFFPIIVICLLVITGGWLTIGALLPRRAEPEVWHRPDISEDMLADLSGTNTEVIQLEASRRRSPTEDDGAPAFDWRTFGLVLGAVVVFAVMLEPVGWILSAALLFWVVAYALGSKRPVFDIGVGLLLSSLVQLAFGAGLGINLPAGFIGGIF